MGVDCYDKFFAVFLLLWVIEYEDAVVYILYTD